VWYGLHIGQLFVGCAVNADDIALLSASCYGLQRLTNICDQYRKLWDCLFNFNPTKSQLVTFGSPNPTACEIHINDKVILWVGKIKYLGVYFRCNTGLTDITDSTRKFYGKFNNIMSTLGNGSCEITALHLTTTYCLPSLLYDCEVWHLTDTNMHKISVAWNSCFRRIFFMLLERECQTITVFLLLNPNIAYHSAAQIAILEKDLLVR